MATIQKIAPCLWFNHNGEEAVSFYTSVFKNSSVGDRTYYTKSGFEHHHMPEGTVLTIEFKLEGVDFVVLNAGPEFKFTEAISFVVNCDSQEEIDYYWGKLTEGGDANAQICGWLKDKFGISWQIVPTDFTEMLKSKDREKAERAMAAMMQMKKLDINQLREVYNGKPGA
jgi:predicted 3-demethylubiquinone-9 3-methyltransferase (glyoxalase superfamily)